jgi:hypothetical protein
LGKQTIKKQISYNTRGVLPFPPRLPLVYFLKKEQKMSKKFDYFLHRIKYSNENLLPPKKTVVFLNFMLYIVALIVVGIIVFGFLRNWILV